MIVLGANMGVVKNVRREGGQKKSARGGQFVRFFQLRNCKQLKTILPIERLIFQQRFFSSNLSTDKSKFNE